MIACNSRAVHTLKRDGVRSAENVRVKSAGVQADFCEELAIEHYAGAGKETLADHPPKWDSRKGVSSVVLDRSTADVYT